MRRMTAAAVAMALMTAACSSGGGAKRTTPAKSVSPPTASATPHVSPGDAALIVAMYNTINRAFKHNPDDGVRAIIAAQDPEDRGDVDFARCINATVPGAKTLPRSKALRFVANVATITPDPGYTLTSSYVRRLHPTGRIYTTKVTITQGTQSSIHQRHQVVRDGRAYQFSTC